MLWRKRMASIIFHLSFTLLTLDISNSLIRIRIEYDAIRQKYLHRPTVNFPSSVVLNSPDDSFFFLKTLSAQSCYKKIYIVQQSRSNPFTFSHLADAFVQGRSMPFLFIHSPLPNNSFRRQALPTNKHS